MVTTLVCLLHCTRGCGCSGTRHSPRPPGRKVFQSSGAARRERERVCEFGSWKNQGEFTRGWTVPKGWANARPIPCLILTLFADDAAPQGIRVNPIRSAHLTIFWRCGCLHFSFRTRASVPLATNRQWFWPRMALSKGLAMLIRSQMYRVQGGAARAARPCAIPAASLPTLLIGGLLLLIGP